MGARPVPAPLEVRPRCGLRAVAQRAVLARLRAYVIARVVGVNEVFGHKRRCTQSNYSATPIVKLKKIAKSCHQYMLSENLGVRARLGNKSRSKPYCPSVGSYQSVFR